MRIVCVRVHICCDESKGLITRNFFATKLNQIFDIEEVGQIWDCHVYCKLVHCVLVHKLGRVSYMFSFGSYGVSVLLM